MKRNIRTRLSGTILLIAVFATLAMVIVIYTSHADARSVGAGIPGISSGERETEHPRETQTVRTEATETRHGEATKTEHPEGTEHPEATKTEHPEATRTEHPEGTEHPEATKTEHPEATRTEHPEGTERPHATETERPHSSSTVTPGGNGQQNASAVVPGTGNRTFNQTGKVVSGIFLQRWDSSGGLAQQGYPISAPMNEVSDLNGKTYTVQYFERSVMEFHSENAAPNNVLLSQLGTLRYRQMYPNGAPSQTEDKANSHLFTETNHWTGGTFLKYWNEHGGLAQQGFPISGEFIEVSPLDGKPYKVQYFERSVMEFHPENAAPNNVLLSQLGTFQHKQKYSGQ